MGDGLFWNIDGFEVQIEAARYPVEMASRGHHSVFERDAVLDEMTEGHHDGVA